MIQRVLCSGALCGWMLVREEEGGEGGKPYQEHTVDHPVIYRLLMRLGYKGHSRQQPPRYNRIVDDKTILGSYNLVDIPHMVGDFMAFTYSGLGTSGFLSWALTFGFVCGE
jgi:hypothetical protein